LVWADLHVDTGAIAVGSFVSYDLLANYVVLPGASSAGCTVVRTHIRTWVTSAVVNGDGLTDALIVDQGDEAQAAPGVPVATAHALTPSTSPNADWMLLREQNAHPGYSMVGPNNQWETDIRSKRKLHELGDTILYVIENRDASAAVMMTFHSRVLLMLP
jgi:hypothetical protein